MRVVARQQARPGGAARVHQTPMRAALLGWPIPGFRARQAGHAPRLVGKARRHHHRQGQDPVHPAHGRPAQSPQGPADSSPRPSARSAIAWPRAGRSSKGRCQGHRRPDRVPWRRTEDPTSRAPYRRCALGAQAGLAGLHVRRTRRSRTGRAREPIEPTFMLDTNICTDSMKRKPPEVSARYAERPTACTALFRGSGVGRGTEGGLPYPPPSIAFSSPLSCSRFRSSKPPTRTPLTKTIGKVGQPLHILSALRRRHWPR